MAADIAAAIGAHARHEGYYEGAGNVVTYLHGHLVELSPPDAYDARYKHWSREDLPIMPSAFRYQVNSKSRARFDAVKKLFAREDITEVVNACDAGREGELIFDLVFKSVRSTLPVSRLWVRSLTAQAIRDAFNLLRPASHYQGLCDAAHARQRADWLVGLNATRAQTIFAREQKCTGIYSLGRVQTPTLAILADRDVAIENFKPTDFFKVKATFRTPKGESYAGWWFTIKPADRSVLDRFETAAEAQAVIARLGAVGLAALVSKKPVTEKPPHFFDLTQLQRAANRRLGFTAAKTLEVAQSLYEKKVVTYPRTSSQYITSDLLRQIAQHVESLAGTPYAEFAAAASARGLNLTAQHVNDAKVTDHHAIIPTTQRPDLAQLSDDERAVYDLVARRFLAAFHPDAQDERTQIISTVGGENFVTKGTREVVRGWRDVEPPLSRAKADDEDGADDADESAPLPEVVQGSRLDAGGFESVKKQTRAPARFTESMLLAAMETAGRVIENVEQREAMKEGGLGTPATRAAIIEKLIERQYLKREGKKFLRSTPLGRELILRLRSSEGRAAILASAELTGQQEAKLARIERGELPSANFLNEIMELTRGIVSGIFAQKADGSLMRPEDSMPCPKCRLAGRSGYLRERKGNKADSQPFLACTTAREECGYVTDVPPNKKAAETLTSKACPKCSGALRVKKGRESGTAFLSCCRYPDCDGVIWLTAKKKQTKGEKQAAGVKTPRAA